MVQPHLPLHGAGRRRSRVRRLDRLLQQFKNTASAGQGILQLRDDAR